MSNERSTQEIELGGTWPHNYEDVLDGFKRRLAFTRSHSAAPTKEQTEYLFVIAELRDASDKDEKVKMNFPGWAQGWSRKDFEKLEQDLREWLEATKSEHYINKHLPKSEPVNEARESSLKEALIRQLEAAKTLRDLARVKKASLELDLRTNYPNEVREAIVKRFEELLIDEVRSLE